MNTVQVLQLVKKETNNKAFRYRYEVLQDGKAIADRLSNREYIACFVTQKRGYTDNAISYDTPHFFSRIDLIGKSNSSKCQPYALAIVDELKDVTIPVFPVSVTKIASNNPAIPGDITILGIEPGAIHF